MWLVPSPHYLPGVPGVAEPVHQPNRCTEGPSSPRGATRCFVCRNTPARVVQAPPLTCGGGRLGSRDQAAYRATCGRRRGTGMNTIVVGTDSSAAADLAVEGAARLARERGDELVVLYVRSDG